MSKKIKYTKTKSKYKFENKVKHFPNSRNSLITIPNEIGREHRDKTVKITLEVLE